MLKERDTGFTGALVRSLANDDMESVAKIHAENFPESRSAILGLWFLQQFYRRRLESPVGICLVLERSGNIVGYVIGGPMSYERTIIRRLQCAAALVILCRPWVAWRLWSTRQSVRKEGGSYQESSGEAIKISSEPLNKPTFFIEMIAVASGRHRKKGYGSELIKAFEARAREKGARSILLKVAKTNLAARRLYVRQGMVVTGNGGASASMLYYGKSLIS